MMATLKKKAPRVKMVRNVYNEKGHLVGKLISETLVVQRYSKGKFPSFDSAAGSRGYILLDYAPPIDLENSILLSFARQ